LALHILLTKADKLNYGTAKNTLLQVQRELKDINFPLTIQLFSALKKTGIDEVHQALDLLFNPVEQSELNEN
jgi:GTP-binding protein